ncbi:MULTISPECIES: hypothetical protein [Shimia]|uniref:hypothetical protein n=1 Tax=Shimia TaxID=573139 RepID=UPI001FB41612|nr:MULTISPECIES: hypothetical protein [Shimia]MDV4145303.1 hypothetical protein [Shimia sp. FJ5]
MTKTALTKFERLEASGLWRAAPDAQRRDVIISIGEATLTISDLQDRPLAHWSLPAVSRLNKGKRPAIYAPDGDPGETLELDESEAHMIEAIESLRAAIDRRRPRPGRLRLVTLSASIASVAALAVFWLPGALLDHTLSVVPDAKRIEIGQELEREMTRLTGEPCRGLLATPALARLAERLDVPRLGVLRGGVRETLPLPGGTILLNRAIVEDYEEPDVAAGYVLAAKADAAARDPLRLLLEAHGPLTTLRLLTTGALPENTLRAHAEEMALATPPRPESETLLGLFTKFEVKSTPYAYALDPSGESTLPLIEADPFETSPRPVLSDGDWVALQGICGG